MNQSAELAIDVLDPPNIYGFGDHTPFVESALNIPCIDSFGRSLASAYIVHEAADNDNIDTEWTIRTPAGLIDCSAVEEEKGNNVENSDTTLIVTFLGRIVGEEDLLFQVEVSKDMFRAAAKEAAVVYLRTNNEISETFVQAIELCRLKIKQELEDTTTIKREPPESPVSMEIPTDRFKTPQFLDDHMAMQARIAADRGDPIQFFIVVVLKTTEPDIAAYEAWDNCDLYAAEIAARKKMDRIENFEKFHIDPEDRKNPTKDPVEFIRRLIAHELDNGVGEDRLEEYLEFRFGGEDLEYVRSITRSLFAFSDDGEKTTDDQPDDFSGTRQSLSDILQLIPNNEAQNSELEVPQDLPDDEHSQAHGATPQFDAMLDRDTLIGFLKAAQDELGISSERAFSKHLGISNTSLRRAMAGEASMDTLTDYIRRCGYSVRPTLEKLDSAEPARADVTVG